MITISRYDLTNENYTLLIHIFLLNLTISNSTNFFQKFDRILASPGLSYAIASDMKGVAFGGCIIFGISDWLDGYIARTYNQKTVLGAFLDPVADKIFISALVFGLTMKGLFPLPLAMVIVARDVILVAGSFILRASERPPGAPFFDTTNSATFEIVASDLSKINTGCQILLLTASVGNFALDFPAEILIEPLWYITAVTTVGSGLGYLDGSGIKRVSKTGEYRSSLPKEEKLI
jgi:cardiolipin synthase